MHARSPVVATMVAAIVHMPHAPAPPVRIARRGADLRYEADVLLSATVATIQRVEEGLPPDVVDADDRPGGKKPVRRRP